MITLGHIRYSNCYPVHAGILNGIVPFPFRIVEGIPTELNRLLYEGKIDVSPSSSIEFAMNPGRYLILPGLSITARREARSIVLQSRYPLEELGGKTVALTSASATSVVLLRILLELKEEVQSDYLVYEQGAEDPSELADAFLTIGDLAFSRVPSERHPHCYDLGAVWNEFTGLPFVFALWHVNFRRSQQHDLERLHGILMESKRYGLSDLKTLADGASGRFDLPARTLVDYWGAFSYDLGANELAGLTSFYRYAAEIGAVPSAPDLRFWTPERGGTQP